MAWVGLGPRLCSWVSLHVYLQGPRSEYGWERLILHQRLRVHSVPGVGRTLRVSPHLTPPQNRGLCGTLFNQLLHHNRPESTLMAAASDDGLITSSVTQGNKERRHHYNLSAHYSLVCFNRFEIRRLTLTESSSFSKQHIRFFALCSSTLEFRQITQNLISHLLLWDLCFISTCMFFSEIGLRDFCLKALKNYL